MEKMGAKKKPGLATGLFRFSSPAFRRATIRF
jgi:hypothetical protein